MSQDQPPLTPDVPGSPAGQPQPAADAKPPGSRLTIVLLAMLLLVVGWGVVYLVQEARVANGRARFKAQMARIALGIQQYEQQFGAFPPAYTVGPDGLPRQSWRVLLLPFLGHQDVYQKLRLDEPWNSPYNSQFHAQRPEELGHPWFRDSLPGEAHVLAIVGRETIWPERYSAKIQDVVDGVANSLMLVGYSEAEINWMEPRDVSRKDVVQKVFAGRNPNAVEWGGVQTAIADGSSKFVRLQIDPDILRSLASINGGAPLAGVDWPPLPVGEMPELKPVLAAEQFPTTDVSPVLTKPIVAGLNVLYCATFQIAWDEWQHATGAKLLGNSPSEMVTELNRSRFDRRNLANDSYIAVAGSPDDVPAIMDQLRTRQLTGPLANELKDVPALGIFIYASLAKQLAFPIKFEHWKEPLQFQLGLKHVDVNSFGIHHDPSDDGLARQLVRQVDVLNHVSDDDFIVKLHTRERRDDIYLAKMKPGKTLSETLKAAQGQIAQPATNGFRKTIGFGDVLQIPILELSVRKDFEELTSLQFQDSKQIERKLFRATQTIQFRLDESGAVIESEALIIGENGGSHYDPERSRKLVFDQPFLLWVQERNATAPYLVAWIVNSEWMTPQH